jgi:hypothetical protein
MTGKLILGGLCLGLALAVAPGCYTTKPNLPKGAKTIAVPVFKNKTYKSDEWTQGEYIRQLETEVTQATRQALSQNGALKLADRGEADLILEAEITRYYTGFLRSDRFGSGGVFQVIVYATYSVYDVKDAQYLIKDGAIASNTDRPEAGVYDTRRGETEASGREEAVESLGRNLARAVVDRW